MDYTDENRNHADMGVRSRAAAADAAAGRDIQWAREDEDEFVRAQAAGLDTLSGRDTQWAREDTHFVRARVIGVIAGGCDDRSSIAEVTWGVTRRTAAELALWRGRDIQWAREDEAPSVRNRALAADAAAGRDIQWARGDEDVSIRLTAVRLDADAGRDILWACEDAHPLVRQDAQRRVANAAALAKHARPFDGNTYDLSPEDEEGYEDFSHR